MVIADEVGRRRVVNHAVCLRLDVPREEIR